MNDQYYDEQFRRVAAYLQQNDPMMQRVQGVIANSLYNRPFSSLDTMARDMSSMAAMTVQNMFGDKLGWNNPADQFAHVYQGIVGSGPIPIAGSNMLSSGTFYGQGFASMDIAAQVLTSYRNQVAKNSTSLGRVGNTFNMSDNIAGQLLGRSMRQMNWQHGDIVSADFGNTLESFNAGMKSLEASGIDIDSDKYKQLNKIRSVLNTIVGGNRQQYLNDDGSFKMSQAAGLVVEAKDIKNFSEEEEELLKQTLTGGLNIKAITTKLRDKNSEFIKKHAENITMLSELFKTEDLNELDSIVQGLGFKSASDSQRITQLKTRMTDAMATAALTGRRTEEVLQEQAALANAAAPMFGGSTPGVIGKMLGDTTVAIGVNNKNGTGIVDGAVTQARDVQALQNSLERNKGIAVLSAALDGKADFLGEAERNRAHDLISRFMSATTPEEKSKLAREAQLFIASNRTLQDGSVQDELLRTYDMSKIIDSDLTTTSARNSQINSIKFAKSNTGKEILGRHNISSSKLAESFSTISQMFNRQFGATSGSVIDEVIKENIVGDKNNLKEILISKGVSEVEAANMEAYIRSTTSALGRADAQTLLANVSNTAQLDVANRGLGIAGNNRKALELFNSNKVNLGDKEELNMFQSAMAGLLGKGTAAQDDVTKAVANMAIKDAKIKGSIGEANLSTSKVLTLSSVNSVQDFVNQVDRISNSELVQKRLGMSAEELSSAITNDPTAIMTKMKENLSSVSTEEGVIVVDKEEVTKAASNLHNFNREHSNLSNLYKQLDKDSKLKNYSLNDLDINKSILSGKLVDAKGKNINENELMEGLAKIATDGSLDESSNTAAKNYLTEWAGKEGATGKDLDRVKAAQAALKTITRSDNVAVKSVLQAVFEEGTFFDNDLADYFEDKYEIGSYSDIEKLYEKANKDDSNAQGKLDKLKADKNFQGIAKFIASGGRGTTGAYDEDGKLISADVGQAILEKFYDLDTGDSQGSTDLGRFVTGHGLRNKVIEKAVEAHGLFDDKDKGNINRIAETLEAINTKIGEPKPEKQGN